MSYKVRKYGGNVNPIGVQHSSQGDVLAAFDSKINFYDCQTGHFLSDFDLSNHNIMHFRVNAKKGNQVLAIDTQGNICGFEKEGSRIFYSHFLKEDMAASIIDSDCGLIYYVTRLASRQLKMLNVNQKKSQDLFTLSSGGEHDTAQLQSQPDLLRHNEIVLQLSPQETFVIFAVDQTLCILDTEDHKLIKQIEHFAWITSIAVTQDEKTLVVGDINGKITYYYNAFTLEANIQKRIVHWHASRVNALAFNNDQSLLFSGGREGVIVIWHQFQDKKDFIPRVGSEILSIQISPDNSELVVVLRENSIKWIKIQNFLERLVIHGIINTCAADTVRRSCYPLLYTAGLQQNRNAPSQIILAANSQPGRIQIVDLLQQRKVQEIEVVSRNIQSNLGEIKPNPADVVAFKFDAGWQYLATASERVDETDQSQTLSCLRFWEQESLYNFKLSTKVEYPHGNHTNGVESFYSQNEKCVKFVSFGSDNKFKVWKQYKKKNQKNRSEAPDITFWNCQLEGSFKNFEIKSIRHAQNDKMEDLLLILAGSVFLIWNLSLNEIEVSEQLPGADAIKLEANLGKDEVVHEINFKNLIDLALDSGGNMVALLSRSDKCSIVLKVDITKKKIKEITALSNIIEQIVYCFKDNESVLLGVDTNNNFLVMEEHFNEIGEGFQQPPATQAAENKKIKIENQPKEQNFDKIYVRQIGYMLRNVPNQIFNFYSKSSHLLPGVDLLCPKLFDRMLIQNKVNDQDQQQQQTISTVSQISNDDEEVDVGNELDSLSDEEIHPASKVEKEEKQVSQIFKNSDRSASETNKILLQARKKIESLFI